MPEQAALDISCRYNHPELTVVQLAPVETLPSLQSEDTWNPAAQGLPADLMDELSQRVSSSRVIQALTMMSAYRTAMLSQCIAHCE